MNSVSTSSLLVTAAEGGPLRIQAQGVSRVPRTCGGWCERGRREAHPALPAISRLLFLFPLTLALALTPVVHHPMLRTTHARQHFPQKLKTRADGGM